VPDALRQLPSRDDAQKSNLEIIMKTYRKMLFSLAAVTALGIAGETLASPSGSKGHAKSSVKSGGSRPASRPTASRPTTPTHAKPATTQPKPTAQHGGAPKGSTVVHKPTTTPTHTGSMKPLGGDAARRTPLNTPPKPTHTIPNGGDVLSRIPTGSTGRTGSLTPTTPQNPKPPTTTGGLPPGSPRTGGGTPPKRPGTDNVNVNRNRNVDINENTNVNVNRNSNTNVNRIGNRGRLAPVPVVFPQAIPGYNPIGGAPTDVVAGRAWRIPVVEVGNTDATTADDGAADGPDVDQDTIRQVLQLPTPNSGDAGDTGATSVEQETAEAIQNSMLIEMPLMADQLDIQQLTESVVGAVMKKNAKGLAFEHTFSIVQATDGKYLVVQRFDADPKVYASQFDSMDEFRNQELPLGSGQRPYAKADIRLFKVQKVTK
jgi:hypothetical protein